MQVEFVAIDKEQPELPYTELDMPVVPFPGEEVRLTKYEPHLEIPFEVRVIRRQFIRGDRVRLFCRVLPPQGTR